MFEFEFDLEFENATWYGASMKLTNDQMPRKRENQCGKKSEVLFSVHAQTSEVNIFHLDQKVAKCPTYARICAKVQLFIARQCPENGSTSCKMRFFAKFPGANGLTLETCNVH